MKTLTVYYSRTGMTRKVAQIINEKVNGEIEEIIDRKDRSGFIGYVLSGRDALLKKKADIKEIRLNPAEYDLVIVGTPVWAGVSTPVRTYLEKYRGSFKKIVFFCTMGGKGDKKTFKEMADLCGQIPDLTLAIKDREITTVNFLGKIDEIIKSAVQI